MKRRTRLLCRMFSVALPCLTIGTTLEAAMHVERLLDEPIIAPASHPGVGRNIQGPSLVLVPEWVPEPLGRYYLYFADHKGKYIRLAYADDVTGPWTVHPPGSLQLGESLFLTEPPPYTDEDAQAARERVRRLGIRLPHDPIEDMIEPHIASPDVHVDPAQRRFVMYYHGLEGLGRQLTRAAVSEDGLSFTARPELLGDSYFRVFRHGTWHYALAMPGQFYRSADGLARFEAGPKLFGNDMRHSAVLVRNDTLYVFWTRVGDAPERILVSTIDVTQPWEAWQASEPQEVLRPERDWEGAGLPAEPSMRSVAPGLMNQLRDPAIFEEDGRVYLLYAIAGESGIGIAEIHFDE